MKCNNTEKQGSKQASKQAKRQSHHHVVSLNLQICSHAGEHNQGSATSLVATTQHNQTDYNSSPGTVPLGLVRILNATPHQVHCTPWHPPALCQALLSTTSCLDLLQ
jgi:hypothetical protein